MKQIAVITGASRGIGKAIAQLLAKESYELILLARDLSKLEEVKNSLTSACTVMSCDVDNLEAVKKTARLISDRHGTVEVLINNVGYGGPYQDITKTTLDEWQKVININLTAAMLFSQTFLPGMKERGSGKIVNISSIFGQGGAENSVPYVCAKHALLGLTRGLAAEWGDAGITVNSICPGYVSTDMTDGIDDKTRAQIITRTPVARFADPLEIAKAVRFLIDSSNGFMNGANLVIDGGYSINLGVS